jgi:hypothetical protein
VAAPTTRPTPGEIGGRNNIRRISMAFSKIGKIAVAVAGLTLATLTASAPASAQWGGPRMESVQYHGGGYGGDHRRREGWRGHHRGPRCFTERVVRHTPYGRRVIERRVCR